MAPTKKRRQGHDRGQVLVDLPVIIADDGETISHHRRAARDGPPVRRSLAAGLRGDEGCSVVYLQPPGVGSKETSTSRGGRTPT